jgi:hypothetical protein
MPGTGGATNVSTAAESAAPVDTAVVSATPADTASEDGPLTSSPPSQGQSLGEPCGDQFCAAVKQRHGFCLCTCTVYSHSFKSCLTYKNKLVLS